MTSDEVGIAEAWWIMDPMGHRVLENQRKKEWLESDEDDEFFGFKVAKIATEDLPPDLWVCDFCNGDIVVHHPVTGGPSMVPMYDSNALCQRCMVEKILMRPEYAAQMQVFMQEGNPTEFWSRRFCSCDACVAEFKKVVGPIVEGMNGQDG